MPGKNSVRQLVETIVSQVLERHVSALREELIARVVGELLPNLATSTGTAPKLLRQAASSIHGSTAQKEILAALLDGAGHFCGRAALFVVRGGGLVGWQGRGFANNDGLKNFSLDGSAGLCGRVLQERIALSGPAGDLDHHFSRAFGPPTDNQVLLLPLMLKEKVAALLYADSGAEAGGNMDAAALELLVQSSSLWLEVLALRRVTAGAPVPIHETVAEAHPERADTTVTPRASMEPIPTAPFPQPAEVAMAAAAAHGSAAAHAFGLAVPLAEPSRDVSDEEIHRKARRFAKLLVDEIKLYNQVKVAEGKKNQDLYDRLKEDIDKSRSAYEKRYGQTAAGAANYFVEEIVRNLADNDSSLLGANFSR